MDAPRADDLDFAKLQLEALLEFGVEGVAWERDNTFGLGRRLGPDDRRAPAGKRQDRERARRQKMLLGAAMVLALMRDIDDNGRLSVSPAMRGDAGSGADCRAGAIGGDDEPRAQRGAAIEFGGLPVAVGAKLGDGGRQERDTFGSRLCGERIDEIAVLDHVSEWLARLDFA